MAITAVAEGYKWADTIEQLAKLEQEIAMRLLTSKGVSRNNLLSSLLIKTVTYNKDDHHYRLTYSFQGKQIGEVRILEGYFDKIMPILREVDHGRFTTVLESGLLDFSRIVKEEGSIKFASMFNGWFGNWVILPSGNKEFVAHGRELAIPKPPSERLRAIASLR